MKNVKLHLEFKWEETCKEIILMSVSFQLHRPFVCQDLPLEDTALQLIWTNALFRSEYRHNS